ncbi:MAG: hypothetical protein ABI321_09215 [Polyangia bacterium]
MSYRDDLDALTARHAALAAEVRTRQHELDDAARLLTEVRARSKLAVLDGIRVAAPCRADWNEMSGDERVRACGACNKNVYNVSEMTRAEAEALILAKEGGCAYATSSAGTERSCSRTARSEPRSAAVVAGSQSA